MLTRPNVRTKLIVVLCTLLISVAFLYKYDGSASHPQQIDYMDGKSLRDHPRAIQAAFRSKEPATESQRSYTEGFHSTASARVNTTVKNLESGPGKKSDTDCMCGNENFCFKSGKRFDCKWLEKLREMRLTSEFDYPQEKVDAEKVVYVTYSSANHYLESKYMLRLLRNTTNNRVIYYDLGDLTDAQADEIKSVCNVEYRKLDYSKYPAAVSQFSNYRFKVIAAAEQFADPSVQAMILFDASGVLKSSPRPLFDAVDSGQLAPVVMPTGSTHSIYAATYPFVYDYLPMDEALAKRKMMRGAPVMLAVKSNATRDVYKWMTLCSLEENCGGDTHKHKVACEFKGDMYKEWAGCHRFDQSNYNLVLMGLFPEKQVYGVSEQVAGVFDAVRDRKFTKKLDIPC